MADETAGFQVIYIELGKDSIENLVEIEDNYVDKNSKLCTNVRQNN